MLHTGNDSGVSSPWAIRAGWLLAALAVAASFEALIKVWAEPDLVKRVGDLLRFFVEFLQQKSGYPPVPLLRTLFVLVAVISVTTALVGAWVLQRARDAAARQAAWLLIVCALQGYWAYFVGTHQRFAELAPWLFSGYQLVHTAVLMALAGYFFVGLARFLVLFPRPVDTWIILDTLPLGSRLRRIAGRDGVLPSVQRWHRSLLSGTALWAGAALAALILPLTGLASRYSPSGLGGGIAFVLLVTGCILFVLGMWFALASMLHVHRYGTNEERRRTAWLRGVALAVVLPLAIGLVMLFIPRDWLRWLAGAHLPEIALAFFVYVLLLPQIISLALSSAVIQKGVLDPRAGFTRITIWTVLGLLLTLLFVFVERVVALKVVAWLQLPPDTGAVLAGALIATTFVPLRAVVSRQVHRLAERWLPLAVVAEGEVVQRTVAITDLSGYTALASRDGEQARLQSAALKRAAQVALDAHGGRLVKSLGDAVMLVFERPAQALAVVRQVHAAFPGMATALGYSPLALHSALHSGEIVEARDGDIFGHTVNVTARLVDAAGAGEIVLSAAVVSANGIDAAVDDIGERRFKNVPEPVRCFRLAAAPATQSESA